MGLAVTHDDAFFGEPELDSLLADPILNMVMEKDGVSLEMIRNLISSKLGQYNEA